MPQTREHLAILGVLGVERGVVALTKRDLVDDEWAALVRADLSAALRKTPLATAPMVEVSAKMKRGLGDLVAAVGGVLADAPARRDISRPRLPLDRVFTLAGFGTIVTGTLVDGTFTVGDEAAILPSGRRARIRGIQTHRKGRESAQPGSRVALNLAGVDKDELERGMVVVRPGTVAATSLIAARLSLLPSASDPLVHDETVKVHVGTAEVMARASLLETNAIAPGGSSWAQLRLAAPTAVAVGDRFVIRRPSPAETLGGGEIADASGERVRRRADALASLERRAGPSPTSRLLDSSSSPKDSRYGSAMPFWRGTRSPRSPFASSVRSPRPIDARRCVPGCRARSFARRSDSCHAVSPRSSKRSLGRDGLSNGAAPSRFPATSRA